MKTCHACGETKRVSEFYRNRARPDGLDTRCKACSIKNTAENRKHRSETAALRRAVFEAFGRQCVWCGTTYDVVISTWVPESKGGQFVLGNLVPTCSECDSTKDGQMPYVIIDDAELTEWVEDRLDQFAVPLAIHIVPVN